MLHFMSSHLIGFLLLYYNKTYWLDKTKESNDKNKPRYSTISTIVTEQMFLFCFNTIN